MSKYYDKNYQKKKYDDYPNYNRGKPYHSYPNNTYNTYNVNRNQRYRNNNSYALEQKMGKVFDIYKDAKKNAVDDFKTDHGNSYNEDLISITNEYVLMLKDSLLYQKENPIEIKKEE